MKSKIIKIILAALIIISLALVTGCSKDEGNKGEAAKADVKPIELRFTTIVGSMHPNFKAFEEFAAEVNKKTNGQVKISVYPTGTLNPPLETLNTVINGLADIGAGAVGYSPQLLPLNELVSTTMMGISSAGESAKIWKDLYNQIPELQKELEKVHVLWFYSTSPLSIGTKVPIKKIEDLKGLSLRFPPGTEALAKAWGVNPVSMPVGEIYTALQKGTIDGFFTGSETLESMRLADYTKYLTNLDMVVGLHPVVVNKKVWDSLPADVQKVINDLIPWAEELTNKKFDEMEKTSVEFAQSKGTQVIKMDDVEKQKAYEIAKPVWAKKAEGLDAKGLPGTKVLTELQKMTIQK